MQLELSRIVLYGTLFSAARIFMGGFLVVYYINNGLTLQDVGFLKSLQAIIIMLADVPTSYYADKNGRKGSLVLAFFLASVYLTLLYVAKTKYIFFTAEIFNALSLAIFNGVFISYIVEISKESQLNTKTLISKFQQWSHIGMFISVILGGLLATIHYSIPFIVSAIIMFLLFLSGYYILPKENIKKKVNKEIKYQLKEDIVLLRSYINKKHMLILFLTGIVANLSFLVMVQFWQAIVYKSLPGKYEYIILSFMMAGIFLIQSFSSYFTAKIHRNRLLILLSAIGLIFVVIAFLYTINIFTFIVILLYFLFYRVLSNILSANIHDMIDNDVRASVESVLGLITQLILSISLPFIGLLLESFGNITLSLIIAVVPILTIIYLINYKERALK